MPNKAGTGEAGRRKVSLPNFTPTSGATHEGFWSYSQKPEVNPATIQGLVLPADDLAIDIADFPGIGPLWFRALPLT
jgi:hypothetical protein